MKGFNINIKKTGTKNREEFETTPEKPPRSCSGSISGLDSCAPPSESVPLITREIPETEICKNFSPHLWKPDICKYCFKSHAGEDGSSFSVLATADQMTNEEEFKSEMLWSTTGEWVRNHKREVELITSALLSTPVVENVMFKDIIVEVDSGISLITQIILKEDYEISSTPEIPEFPTFLPLLTPRGLKPSSDEKKISELESRITELEKQLRESQRSLLEASKAKMEIEHQWKIKYAEKEREAAKFLLEKTELERERASAEETEKINELRNQITKQLEDQKIQFKREKEMLKEMRKEELKKLKEVEKMEKEIERKEKELLEKEKEKEIEFQKREIESKEQEYLKIKLLEEKTKVALVKPLIQVEGDYQIWPNQDDPVVGPRIFIFDYPENDIFYYRDNFMIHPASYKEIESSLKFFSPSSAKLVQAVTPAHFHEHINFFILGESNCVVSVTRILNESGSILGLLRSKNCDSPFVLDDIKPIDRTAGLPIREILLSFRKKYPQYRDVKFHVVTLLGKLRKSILYNNKEKASQSCAFLPQALLELDRKLKVRHYKFGVIYVKENQTAEDAWNNRAEDTSPDFWRFMELLGDKIKLKGWKGYKADLDVKSNTTCLYTYFTEYHELEVMFHVAPWLFDECRKRLIGNDVVNIIWCENTTWNPNFINSTVCHAQVVIRPIPSVHTDSILLKVEVVAREGMEPTFPPSENKLWGLDDQFRDFLLQKCINTERAAWHCPNKIRTQSRSLRDHHILTRDGQIQFLVDKFINETKEY
eukprot:TRINITY_DN12945_c0_g1_i6.p1 TRINITY_DN12945_c0_g1~~TRINITY_DN12945_c0_g1_i6.p1  ORF type:complete len:768 (+),score=181.03 TRINITY_DN12945_c0_g1_i6:196-2499(+)